MPSRLLPVPMSDAIAFREDGTPYLAGLRCLNCGEVIPGRRMACLACLEAEGLELADLGSSGTIFAWTIVYRSYPGVPVPLVSAVVRLASGAHVRGNVEGLVPEAEAVAKCPRVILAFATLEAPDGTELIRYFFKPLAGEVQ